MARGSKWRAKVPVDVWVMLPDLEKGLRAAVALIPAFTLAGTLHIQTLTWTALAGWLVTLGDPGGTRAARARAVVPFAIAGSFAVMVAEACPPWISPLALGLACFAFSLLRALGAAGATIGNLLALVFAIALDQDEPTPLRSGAYFALGAAWALLLTSVIWPVRTHLPLRRVLARMFRELGAYAASLSAATQQGIAAGDPHWSALARRHRKALRELREEARSVAVALRARRPGASAMGVSLRLLLGMAESQLTLLIAIGEELEQLEGSKAAEHADTLARAAQGNAAIAHALLARTIPAEFAAMHSDMTLLEKLDQTLASSLQTVRGLELSTPRNSLPPQPEITSEPSFQEGIRKLLDALSPSSLVGRHSLRVAFAAVGAGMIGEVVSPEHGHWITVTVIAVLQPYAGTTWQRALERVVGTVLGCLLAIAIGAVVDSWAIMLAILFPLSIAAVATRPRSYRLFTLFLTPVFVLLATHFGGDWQVAWIRAGDAVVGGITAVAMAFLLFPSWERETLPSAVGAMLDAAAEYGAIALGNEGDIAKARSACSIALANAETSLERLLAEPRPQKALVGRALALVTYGRRMIGAFTTVLMLRQERGVTVDPRLSAPLLESMHRLASLVREERAERLPVPAFDPTRLPEPLQRYGRNIARYFELMLSA